MAGDMGRATDLLAKYRRHLRDRTDSLEDHTIIDILSEPPRVMRRNLIEAHIHSRTGLTFSEFMAWGASAHPPDVYHRVSSELDSITLGCELLIVGFIEGIPRLFQVQEDGSVVEQAHFAAIGAGATVARSALLQRQYTWNKPKNQAMYLVYEAKQLSQIAPGVGPETEICFVRWRGAGNPVSVQALGSCWDLEEYLKRYGPQPLPIGDFPDIDPRLFDEMNDPE
jgi:hypothetical protein